MRLLLIVGFIFLVFSCKQKTGIGRYISEKDTTFTQDIRDISKKINNNVNSAELYYLRANTFYFTDKFKDAEIDFTSAVTLDSNNALYNYRLGECFLKLDTTNSLKAFLYLEKALKLKPNYNEVKKVLVTLLIARQEYAKADVFIEQLIIDPIFAEEMWILRGIAKKEQKDTANAIICMEKALQINPNSINAVSQIANMYLAKGNPLAKSYFEKVLKLDEYNYDAYYHLGLIAQRAGNFETALKLYDQTRSIKKEYVFAWYNAAVIYLEMNNLDKAETYAIQTTEYNPFFANAWALQGYIKKLTGDNEMAKQFFNKALKLDPKNSRALKGIQGI